MGKFNSFQPHTFYHYTKIIEHMMKPSPSSNSSLAGGEPEWWEFFPSSISPFWYNETVANEYFPLSRSSVILSEWNESKDPLDNNFISKQSLRDSSTSLWMTNNAIQWMFPSSREWQESMITSDNEVIIDSWISEKTRLLHTSQWLFKKWPIFNRSDYESPFPKVDKIIKASMLPDDITKIPDGYTKPGNWMWNN